MAHSFCKHLSNSYKFINRLGNNGQYQLQYQPCCWVPAQTVTDRTSLIAAQAAITARVEANKESLCRECLMRERIPGYRRSGRQQAHDDIPDGAVDGEAYTLDFQIDTNCNAACAMCGPHFSSLWQKQFKTTPIQDFAVQNMTEQALSMITFDKVTMIRFMGGEPLLTELHITVLKLVLDPSKVTLIYSTNGSIYPSNEVLELWSRFKKIKVSVSIDGVDDHFHYIRWPLKWDWVSSNLAEIAKIPKVELWINYTINPMNALYILDFEKWVTETNENNNINIQWVYSPCYGIWGLDKTPLELFKIFLTFFPENHRATKVMQGVRLPPEDISYQLVDNMNYLDEVRDLNWRETFSRVAKYYK